MMGLVVILSPSRKFGDPLIEPLTEPSAFAFQPERAGTPLGAAFFGGAAFFTTGAFLGGGAAFFTTGAFLGGGGVFFAGAPKGLGFASWVFGKERVGAFFTGAGFAFGLLAAGGALGLSSESPPPKISKREKVAFGGASASLFSSIAFLWLVSVIVGDDPSTFANLEATLVGGSADRKYREPVAVVTVPPFSILPPAIVVVSTKSPSSKFGEP
mmetsp:Transcript_26539/g.64694  ORF Transcript_26539/g.64694 Transcript_26539/m.64694 type:complete len:213 (-) Transcript_26539:378-1016(-)